MFFGGGGFGGGDPFEQFGGMPGGGGRAGGRGAAGPIDNEGYYKLLGVTKDADANAVKKAYRKLALIHHPDKGGDVEKFKEISAAADVLCDPEKKKIYDQHGKEGLEGSGGGEGHNPEDIFSMFFGGGRGGGGGRERGPQKGEDIVHSVKASLEDLYNGKTVRLAIQRNKPCVDCSGRGGKVGAEKACSDCNGRGAKVQLRQIGPGMVQQIQSVCPTCKGACKVIDEKDKCKACKGSKTFKDRKVLEVAIEKGMKNGQKIKFSGEADEVPGTSPGDVVIVIQEKEHETFKRKGADLVYEMPISLSEALCGFTRTIKHLDGRVLKLDNAAGQVVKQDAIKMINGEGMPYHGNPFTKGRLFVHFTITFPKTLAPNVVAALLSVLPRPAAPVLTGEEEDCSLVDVDVTQIGKDQGQSGYSNEEDDEEGGGGAQRVQCGQA